MTWDDAVRLASQLPLVDVSTSYGTPALKVKGKLLTRLRPEEDSLVLFDVALDERDMLIAAEPGTFHTTPHYDGYPAVLARLGRLEPQQLRSFLDRRWCTIAPKRAVAEWRGREDRAG